MRQLISICVLSVPLLLTGCDVKNEPLPLNDSPLVGVWEAEVHQETDDLKQFQKMYVEFTEAGYVALHRMNCWKKANAPTQVWQMKDFKIDFMPVIKLTKVKIKAQWMPFTPKIEMKLDSWPTEDNGVTKMSIDGIELVAMPQASDRTQWSCDQAAAK